MKEWLLIFRNVFVVLIVVFIGQLLPPMHWLDEWITPQKKQLAWTVGGVAFVGWLVLMGATIYRIFHGGMQLDRNGIEASVKSVKDSMEVPYSTRKSKYWIPNKAVGIGFSDQVSIGEFKYAWSQGLWRTQPRWRGLFLMALGAFMMMLGGFGLIIVLCPIGVKFLAVCALGYALVNITRAFFRSSPD